MQAEGTCLLASRMFRVCSQAAEQGLCYPQDHASRLDMKIFKSIYEAIGLDVAASFLAWQFVTKGQSRFGSQAAANLCGAQMT